MLKKIQRNFNKKGFTLVELIIVIAVMAILAAIVVPRMSGITKSFRESADERVCANYAREIELLIQTGKLSPVPASGTSVFGEVEDIADVSVDKAPQSLATNSDTDDFHYLIVLESVGVYNVYVYVAEADATTVADEAAADARVKDIPSAKVEKVSVIK